MKRRYTHMYTLLIAIIFTANIYADYDKSAVKAIMRNNFDTLNVLKKAVKASDFASAEQAFKTFASDMKPLLQMTPPHGSKADWDASINEFIAAALTGAKASSERDIDKTKKALDNIQELAKNGHGKFR